MPVSKKVTGCGGGSGGLAMAADLKLKGHKVKLFELPSFESNLNPSLIREGFGSRVIRLRVRPV
jgi:2-polyprenyl-6-methoxyphenol hydroxylase-like FAD-dependent oxidoreductase